MLSAAATSVAPRCVPTPKECSLSSRPGLFDATGLPRARATLLCDADPDVHGAMLATLGDRDARTSIAIVYGFNRTRVRYILAKTPFASYLKDMTLALRLVLSLRAVGTTLPIKMLLSGERHEQYERLFEAQGVTVIGVDDQPPPSWANAWHAATFTKLTALAYSAQQNAKLIVLDVDAVAFRNIDHLSAAPAPSFVYHLTGCNAPTRCCGDLNSGVMVLRASAIEAARSTALLESIKHKRHSPGGGDGGDQSFWRLLYPEVNELPAGYNAIKKDLANWSSSRAEVHLLHDMWPSRWSAWWVGPWRRWLDNLTSASSQIMRREALDRFMSAKALARNSTACYSKELMHSICAKDPALSRALGRPRERSTRV